MICRLLPIVAISLLCGTIARAQEAPPPAYLSVVEGTVTLQRDGEVLPATLNMPFVPGDRLRTENGRVQVMFPDGSAIEVDAYSEIECVSPTRVRLLAGTMDHLQRDMTRSASAQYLPQELDTYGTTLDQYGAWQYAAPYGYVWYPTVAADWRPYYQGYWSPVRSYGWTWIGVDSWAWPTHHYGRWGLANSRWFWIPGRTWGPAWVSWAGAADYVSWCPLGFDSRPVFAPGIGSRNTWAGWTVLPRAHFGAHQYYAHRYAIDSRRIPVNTPFIAHNTPPLPQGRGQRARVDSGLAASVGSIAVPRQSPVAGRRPPADARQLPIAGRQPPSGARQAPTESRPALVAAPQPGDAGWSKNPQSGVRTHYGIAVPRTMIVPPADGQPRTGPDTRPPAPDYRGAVPRGAVPAYQPPNGQRMEPRVASPVPSAAQQPPAATAPYARPVPAQMGVPRAMMPPAPANNPPPQAAPPSAAPPARSVPRGQAPQGQAQPRGEGPPAGSRRPR